MTKKHILLVILLAPTFLLNAQNQQLNQDSLSFVKTKGEFVKYEQEHGHYIQTNNVKMHYLSWGKPTGKPFVWVHGTYSNSYEFFGFADSLVKLGYYVIAIDYYGHGFTPIPDKEVSLYSVADDIKFLLDKLKIKKAVFGGWSRGGCVATAFYDAYPDYVYGLILEDGGSVAAATTDDKLSIDSFTVNAKNNIDGLKKYMGQEFESAFDAVKGTCGFKNKGDIFWALSAFKNNAAVKYVVSPQVAELIGMSDLDEYLTVFYRPFASNKLFATSYITLSPQIIYRNLNVPMLILDPISENDEFKVEKENAALQQSHPEFVVHKIYKNTSHSLKGERPDEFLKDVISFLSKVKNSMTK
jgi:pimeloyl-ACP methyl ester carboxylesterase